MGYLGIISQAITVDIDKEQPVKGSMRDVANNACECGTIV